MSLIIYVFLYLILGQKQSTAENRSVLLGGLVLVYMILFGHGLPTSINKNLF